MDEKKKPESEDRIRKPEGDKKGDEVSGATERALRGLGKIIPGLGELVKGLEKSEVFQERIKATDAEMERHLGKTPPLKRVEMPRRSIIPPKAPLKVSRSTLRGEAAAQSHWREMTTDIFDEGDCLKVIAEMPGVDEKQIKAEVKDNLLILTTQATGQEYYKEIELPCSVKGEMNLAYNNGILQITIKKEYI